MPIFDSVPLHVLAILIAPAIIWAGSAALEQATERLWPRVRDDTDPRPETAIVGSLPEIATVILAGAVGAFELGLGAVLGSALVNVLVVPAVLGIAAAGAIESSRRAVYEKTQSYLVAILAITLVFALASIYGRTSGMTATASVPRSAGVVLLVLFGLYRWLLPAEGTPATDRPPVAERELRDWGWLLGGAAVLLAGVGVLVSAVVELTAVFGAPAFLVGVTFLALATSVPDLVAVLRAHGAGAEATSLVSGFDSNTADLLVAIPLGLLVFGPVTVPAGAVISVISVLAVATLLLVTLLRTDLELHTGEAVALLLTYAVVFAWILAEAVGTTTLLPL